MNGVWRANQAVRTAPLRLDFRSTETLFITHSSCEFPLRPTFPLFYGVNIFSRLVRKAPCRAAFKARFPRFLYIVDIDPGTVSNFLRSGRVREILYARSPLSPCGKGTPISLKRMLTVSSS